MVSSRKRITMFGAFPQPRHMPCSECGASVALKETDEHVCDGEQLLDYRLFQLRDEIAEFEAQLSAWLLSEEGRFAVWVAERERG